MKKIRAAVVGYGNIGHYSVQALEAALASYVVRAIRTNPQSWLLMKWLTTSPS